VPATGVAGRGLVGELDWMGTISDKGTAVGLVEAKTPVGVVIVVEVGPLVMPVPEVTAGGVTPEGEGVGVDVTGDDVAWRSIK